MTRRPAPSLTSQTEACARVLLVATALTALGCGRSVAQDSGAVIASDPELRAMAEEMLPAVERLSGLPAKQPIRIDVRTRAQLEEYLLAQLDAEVTPERAEQTVQAYALLGMMPEGLDLRALLLSVLREQVAGFYDPDSTTLYLMDDQDPALVSTILVHELVHAVQDQHEDLDAITADVLGNDRQMAAKAALEGHATLVMMAHMMEAMTGSPVDPAGLPDLAAFGGITPALIESQSPALAAAPLVLRESLIFPYIGGMSLVQSLWRAEGGPAAPLGVRLPRSTEQVLWPETFLAPQPDEPTELRFSSDERPDYENSLGAVEVGVMLEELLDPSAREFARGWDGDRFALFGTGPEASLVWASVWDDEGSRDRFLDALAPALPGLPRPARIERVSLDGRPGALLRVGDPPEVTVELGAGPGAAVPGADVGTR